MFPAVRRGKSFLRSLINGQTATHDWRLAGPPGRDDLCLHTQFLPHPFVYSSLSLILSSDSPLFVPWVFLLGPQASASSLQSNGVSHLSLFEIGSCFAAEVDLVVGILQPQPLSKCRVSGCSDPARLMFSNPLMVQAVQLPASVKMSRVPGVHFSERKGGKGRNTPRVSLWPNGKSSLGGGCVAVVVIHSTFIESSLGKRP